jgi:hypothetical protein
MTLKSLLLRFAHFVEGGLRFFVEQRLGGEQHPRCAVAALRRAEIGERRLQRVQVRAVGHAFDGVDFGAFGLEAEHQARQHRLAVDQDGAGAALAELATVFGAGEPEVFAQYLEQSLVGREAGFHRVAVHGELDVCFRGCWHGCPISHCRRASATNRTSASSNRRGLARRDPSRISAAVSCASLHAPHVAHIPPKGEASPHMSGPTDNALHSQLQRITEGAGAHGSGVVLA